MLRSFRWCVKISYLTYKLGICGFKTVLGHALLIAACKLSLWFRNLGRPWTRGLPRRCNCLSSCNTQSWCSWSGCRCLSCSQKGTDDSQGSHSWCTLCGSPLHHDSRQLSVAVPAFWQTLFKLQKEKRDKSLAWVFRSGWILLNE